MKLKHFLLFFFSALSICCSTFQNKNLVTKKYERFPLESFVLIDKQSKMSRCSIDKNTNVICETRLIRGSGSGFIIKKTKGKTYILTAGHVCHAMFKTIVEDKTSILLRLTDLHGKTYSSAKIEVVDSSKDICLLSSNFSFGKEIKLSKRAPKIKDRVYNVASPNRIFSKEMVPIFEGFFIGKAIIEKELASFYSLSAAPGSSGSMILNRFGHLIGMLTMTHSNIPISIGPSYENLKRFIEENLLNKKE